MQTSATVKQSGNPYPFPLFESLLKGVRGKLFFRKVFPACTSVSAPTTVTIFADMTYDDIEGGGKMKPKMTMRESTAAVGSVTLAMRAQQALAQAAIPATVVKLEASSSRRGCVYGVQFSCLQEYNVKKVLEVARIQVKQWNRME